MIGKTWPWWQLWLAVKPNLRSSKFAEIKVMHNLYSYCKLFAKLLLFIILEFSILICAVCIFQAKLEEQTQKAEKEREGAKLERMKASAINEKLAAEKAELDEALAKGDEVVNEMSTKVKQLEAEKNHLDKQVSIKQNIYPTCISNSIIS